MRTLTGGNMHIGKPAIGWRGLFAIGTALAAGCTSGAGQDAATGVLHEAAIATGCPDPSTCTVGNGTGVYYEEGGEAGIDTFHLMLTHFINNYGPYYKVGFQGRFYNAAKGYWQTLGTPGIVQNAIYNGQTVRVESIHQYSSAYATYPVVTLEGGVVVYGADLGKLELVLETLGADIDINLYQVSFAPAAYDASQNYELGQGNPGYQFPIYKWDMKWRYANTDISTAQPYCKRAPQHVVLFGTPITYQPDDSVVFQENIDADAPTGKVTAAPGHMTVSCRYGALATAFSWGYDHNSDLWHFASAIQMKRASYCADVNFATVSGTHIKVRDEEGAMNKQDAAVLDSAVEAFWSPSGAVCYNGPRRADLASYNITPFPVHGTCLRNGQNVVIPTCNEWTWAPYYDSVNQAMSYAQLYSTHALVDAPYGQ
jgi:hypothetical protein